MNTWATYFLMTHREEASQLETKVLLWTKFFHDMSEEIAEKISNEIESTYQWIEDDERMHSPSKQYRFYEYMINFINELQGTI